MSDGSIITFYSYKGGVGRSFLLANVAATLSRWGYRVLCVDFDLEAPGLWHYFSGWTRADEHAPESQSLGDYGLTARELDVVRLLIEGLAQREIAIRLNSSESTIKIHVSSIYRKLGVHNRAAAVKAILALHQHGSRLNTESVIDPAAEVIAGSDTEIAQVESTRPGLLDLVEAFDRGDSAELEDFLTHIDLPEPHAGLELLSAGRRDASYMARVQQLDWGRLYAERNLGAKFERIRSAWASQFDFVLIDSRTGVSDTGGICTAQLPDILVTVFAANRQNLDGIMEVAAKSAARRNELPYDRQSVIILPVLSRFDQRTEQELAKEWGKLVERRLESLLKPWIHRDVTPAQFFERVLVPYFSAWSFGEDVPAIEAQENSGPEGITYYIDTVSALLAKRGAGTEELVANRDGYVSSARSKGSNAGMPRYQVYLSYSRVDQDFARALTAQLERAGLSVFFDNTNTGALLGEALSHRITDALRSSAAMVALVGKAPTRWQIENIRLFLSQAKPGDRAVIPVLLPQADQPSIPRFLRQYKEVSTEGRGIDEVVRSIADMLHTYQVPGAP